MGAENPDANRYRTVLLEAMDAAVATALPQNILASCLPDPPAGTLYVVGAGKAAAQMARVFESLWTGPLEGVVVTRYGHAVPTSRIAVRDAAHPVPDAAGAAAAEEILGIAGQAGEDDLVVCLLSGGGSALLTCPPDGVALADMQALSKALLASGADIREINTVRKHINRAFGGRLAAAAAPARMLTLAISDVAGDDPATIASGPTVGDPTTLAQARAVLEKYGIVAAPAIAALLDDPAQETPKPDDPLFARTTYRLIATPQAALDAAADCVRAHGFTPFILSSEIEGDTNEAAAFHVALVRQILRHGQPLPRPCALISGGETTVRLTGTGEGGPNTQFMLAAAILLDGAQDVYALSCDTDGIDGSKDNAGALIGPDTLARARARGLDPPAFLENNDSYGFFSALGDCVTPGPTHTNVNDLRIFLVV